VDIAENILRSQVKGQWSKVKVICVQMCECCNDGGIHFGGVAGGSLVLLSYIMYFLSYTSITSPLSTENDV